MNIKTRLIIMNFLQFAVWGAYLTSMGTYLAQIGLGAHMPFVGSSIHGERRMVWHVGR